MGFDVYGPTRRVQAADVDRADGQYDLLAMPAEYGLRCPQLENLSRRFYDSTVLRFADGAVHALRDELVRLRDTYRAKREPELIAERRIRARDPEIRRAAAERVLEEDRVYRTLEEFRLLCDEALAAEADVRCEGD